jgi:aspartyl-tRNA(Asn)/glutamyl-tRNA(Gln) amidotransferase subunit B
MAPTPVGAVPKEQLTTEKCYNGKPVQHLPLIGILPMYMLFPMRGIMKYEVTIGLEVHAQILTESKMFCGCSAQYWEAEPNSHVCPVCLGLPGALPVLNQRAIERAILTGMALNCTIQKHNSVSRKNYFYPDIPSSYQRSQFDDPLCAGGYVDLVSESGTRRIGVTRVHIEEDTGKLNHSDDGTSLVDFNRAGVPLMEIVSEPDITSPEEARVYFQKIREILLWIGVNIGDMEKGALRCDANISLRPKGQKEYGSKVEIKNMNSFRSVERALIYEIERQAKELDAGNKIPQSTRGWDDTTGRTELQRVKESADDYRYFPDPDIPPLEISDELVESLRASLPELLDARRARFVSEYGLSAYDAEVLTSERFVSEYYERAVSAGRDKGVSPKEVSNWATGELFRLLKETGEELKDIESRFPAEFIAETQELLTKGTITRANAKEVFEISFRTGQKPAEVVAERGMAVISAGDAIDKMAQEAIDNNPKAVEEYRKGKLTAIKFLVGQVMRVSKGQASPQAVQEALEKLLSE